MVWVALLAVGMARAEGLVKVHRSFNGLRAGSDGAPAWLPQTPEWKARDGGYEFGEPRREGSIAWLTGRVFADADVSVRFRIAEEGRGVRAPGLVLRSTSSADFHYVHYDSLSSQVIIVRSASGNPWIELRRVQGVPISRGEWHQARVTCQGSHLAAYLDGKLIAEAEDSALGAGLVGLRAGQGRILFDDFRVIGTSGSLEKEWVLMPESKPNDDLDRPELRNAERVVAVRGGGYFPVLIKLQDGSLAAVVRGGAPHIGIKGRLDWIRSADGGRTWSKPSVIVDSQWDDRNPSVGQMKDGTIVVGYGECRCYNEKGEWDHPKAEEFVLFYKLSRDGGATWTEKQPLYSGAVGGGCSPFGRTLVLGDGTALLPVYGQRDPAWQGPPAPEEVKGDMVGVVRSRDNGRTWSDFSLVSCKGHNEMSLLALDDKHLLAVIRTSGDAHLDQFESLDGGYTWTGPRPLTQASQHPADIVRLASGKLLLVWGNRREPLGVGGMLSGDNGATWGYDRRVMLGWTSLNGDCGYPSVVQLGDGTIVLMYYAVGTHDLGPEEFALVARFTEEALAAAARSGDPRSR